MNSDTPPSTADSAAFPRNGLPSDSPTPVRRSNRRAAAFFFGGVLLIAMGGICAVIEYRASTHTPALWEATLAPEQTVPHFSTPPITFGRNELGLKVRASAPLDNAWLTIELIAVDSDGHAAARGQFGLTYYHGLKNGHERSTGSQAASEMFMLPAAGTYTLRFLVKGAEGANAVPAALPPARPLHLQILPGKPAISRLRVVGFMVFAALGAALLLHALAHPTAIARSTPRPARAASGERLVFLDALRGLACMGVLLCHLLTPGISHIESRLREVLPSSVITILRHGDLGVEIFFALSGFVIAYSLRNSRFTLGLAWRFAARRALRLDPPYHVALLLTAGLAALKLTDTFYELSPYYQGAIGLLANLFYLQDIFSFAAPISVAWTLCLEIQFYLAYIILASLAQALGVWLRQRADPIATCLPWLPSLIVFGPLAAWSVQSWYPMLLDFSFAGTWFRFFLGVMTCWAIKTRTRRVSLLGAIVLLLLASVATHDARGAVAAVTCGLILFAAQQAGLTKWLSGNVWQYLGRISYSLYLAHIVLGVPFVNWLWDHVPHSDGNALALLAVGAGSSIGFAHAFHLLYERPSIALSRRIHYPKSSFSVDSDRPALNPTGVSVAPS